MKKLTILLAALLATFCLTPLALAADESGGTNITVVLPSEQSRQPDPQSPALTAITTALYPSNVEELRLGEGKRQIVKTYELDATETPNSIPRTAFERDGWLYELTDITRAETSNAQSKAHTETVTVETQSKDMQEIMSKLAPSLYYHAGDGFDGTLHLDVESVTVEQAGTKTSSYTAKTTREYPNLSANDTSLLPKTVTDNGRTLTLSSVSWTEVNGLYNARAEYAATASKTVVTGYITTAKYKGTLMKLVDGKTIYAAYFDGTEIVPETKPLVYTEVASSPKPSAEPITVVADSGNSGGTGVIIAIVVALLGGAFVGWCVARKNKKAPAIAIALALLTFSTIPAFAYDYDFESGGDTLGGFGHSTSADVFVQPDPLTVNARRNKDAAHFPPPYLVGGNIPTEPVSYYYEPDTGASSVVIASGSGGGINASLPNNDIMTSTSVLPNVTAPSYYDDSTIGTLTITKLGKSFKVYEGEDLSNMKTDVAHFDSTSAWDGNVGLASHNRNGVFGFVKDLQIGDTLTYATPYGTRTYAVTSKERVDENDRSGLAYSASNTLTLYTCVENVPSQRWCVKATEIGG